MRLVKRDTLLFEYSLARNAQFPGFPRKRTREICIIMDLAMVHILPLSLHSH